MTEAADVIRTASYRAFYDLIACSLETHNPERAAKYVREAADYLPQTDANQLVVELEAEYYEFT